MKILNIQHMKISIFKTSTECGCVHTVCMCVSEDSLQESVPPFHHRGSRRGHKCLYLLSTLTVPFAFDLRHSLNIVGQGDLKLKKP